LLIFSAILSLSLLAINQFDTIVHGESLVAYLFVTKPMYIAKEIGEVFNLAINISNVNNLRTLEFTLTYNTSILDVEQVIQGSFFPLPPKSYSKFEIGESLGFVRVNMSLAGSETPRGGNGTLVWIVFKVVQGLDTCGSPLSLEQTLLLDSASNPIVHDVVGAVYFWKSTQPDPPVAGLLLDVYTQKDGVGSNEPGGEFTCGEKVQLTSLVTYNDWAVQIKLVGFEVRNPLDEIVLVMVAQTDKEGFAEISFRIPRLWSSNGTWKAFSVVEVADKIVWDTLTFDVYCLIPVGGYSFPITEYRTEKPLVLCLALVATLTAGLTIARRKIMRLS
jgi:hypothetical protein